MTGLQAAILGGSALILLVLALRLGLQRHLPRRLFPALWCAAAVRLLLPVSIPTRLSIWNLFERTSASAAAGAVSRALLPFPDLTDGAAMVSAPSASARVSPVSLVWLAGTVLLAAYVSIGCIFMVRGFRSARIAPCPSMDVLLDVFRFRKSPRIRATSSRRAPLTFGVLRPVILLPEGLAAESEPFRLVLAHELAHVKRRDCVRKLLFTVCLCLYWWNPLVWCMVILAGHDMELACDEAVLRALGPGCRKAYALTLLSMAARSPAPAPLTASFSGSSLSRRIRAIARFRPVSKWAGVCAAIVFVLSACVFSTQAASRSIRTKIGCPRTPAGRGHRSLALFAGGDRTGRTGGTGRSGISGESTGDDRSEVRLAAGKRRCCCERFLRLAGASGLQDGILPRRC